jgi:hypothetical protein
MKPSKWFSTKIRFVFATKRNGWLDYSDSLFMLKAVDFKSAFECALAIGRKREESFINDAGDTVVVQLKEVLTLDMVRAASLDGAEIFHESMDIPKADLGAKLKPEESQPRQTI